MVGMRMGDDQPRDLHMPQRPLEQRGPRRNGFLIAESGIDHRPAVAVGQQVDVHVIEPERQLQADPKHAGHDLDDLIVAGVVFPGVSQCLGRGLHGVGFRMHATGLAVEAAPR